MRVTNSGISGDNSQMLLARWERDVRALDPQWVSICIGINDVWRQFDSPAIKEQTISPEEYRENVRKMILTEKPHVKGIFLMTPYYMEPNASDFMRARMDEYGRSARSWLRNTAAFSSICRQCSANTAPSGIPPIWRGIGCIRTRSAQR